MTESHSSSQAIVKGNRKNIQEKAFSTLKFQAKKFLEWFTSESVKTFTNVPVDIIDTSGIILARIGHAFIDVNLAGFT